MNPQPDHGHPPEEARREPGLPSRFPDDFISNAPTKYGPFEEKSILAAAEPAFRVLEDTFGSAPTHQKTYLCSYDVTSGPGEHYGVFRVQEWGHPLQWIIARYPRSWPPGVYSSDRAVPSPEGSVEAPNSVLPAFATETAARQALDRMIRTH
jgi:hypothetical protein